MDFICSVKGTMLQFNDFAWQDILRRSSINQTSFTCLSIRPRNSCLFEDNEQTRSLQLWAYLYILFPKRNATSHWAPNIWLLLFWCESSMLNNDWYLVVHVSLNNTEIEMLEERCTSTYTDKIRHLLYKCSYFLCAVYTLEYVWPTFNDEINM